MAFLFSLSFSISLFLILFATTQTTSQNLFSQPPQPTHNSLSCTSISTSDNTSSPSLLLESILSHLGLHQLSAAIPSLTQLFPAISSWNGPLTLFAPSDLSLQSCSITTCLSNPNPSPNLLAEHLIPGFFSLSSLQSLTLGTRIETFHSGHCLTVTSVTDTVKNNAQTFINGVEITHPEIFNNGLIIVHGLADGFISPLSAFSCDPSQLQSPPPSSRPPSLPLQPLTSAFPLPQLLMSLMLRDAIVRLRYGGFGVLSIAMKIHFKDLMKLQNATMFALEDGVIFSDTRNYASNVRFHILPNRYLATKDFESLPVGTTLETLERGNDLVVTSAGGLTRIAINNVGVKTPEVVKNLKIVVHSAFMAFERSHHVGSVAIDGAGGSLGMNPTVGNGASVNATGSRGEYESIEERGACGLGSKSTSIEDHHGL